MKKIHLLYSLAIVLFSSCDTTDTSSESLIADMVFFNGSIYTMDVEMPVAEAVAVKADTIIFVGKADGLNSYLGENTNKVDLQGKTLIPGFVEGHAHIMGIGYNLLNVDLRKARNYEEMIEMVAARADETPEGEWIIGRGWHQDKWMERPEMVQGFPTHDQLSQAVPDHPVFLKHASGHASMVNQKAMDLAGINSETAQPDGGEFFQTVTGQPTGLLNETAQGLVADVLPQETKERDQQALNLALEECFKYGITGLHQAGSGSKHIQLFKDFAKKGELKLRLYVMLKGTEDQLLKTYFEEGIEEDLFNNQLTMRSVKLYADGALGSRGAWLLEEYSDAPGVHGHNVMSLDSIREITKKAHQAGFQVCIHAIGDRANREVLDIYEDTFTQHSEKAPDDHRFRIEHAQHFHPDDIPRFVELGVIPSMQAIHMSSDRPWAIARLGVRRIEWGAYMWQTLLQSGARIVNGTDAPVEPVSPIASFYASVTRKTLKGSPDGGYEPSEKMTREQALRSYTLDAAYAAFRDDRKGSLEVGKWADFTLLNRDIMTIPEEEILGTQVAMTIIGGEIIYTMDEPEKDSK
ncbi:MAG: amidohydrolase [Bacteroidota bacterium]